VSAKCLPVVLVIASCFESVLYAAPSADGAGVAALAAEVRNKGWIGYCSRSPKDDFDLFLVRPDGSGSRNITNTPDFYEGGIRFSPDGKQILYRRIPKDTKVYRNQWGFQGRLILANADGSDPVELGKDGEYPWASWSHDGKEIACLTRREIQVVDLATKKQVRSLSRKGFYQQLFWSSDGKWLCGVTNAFGQDWTIGRMNVETGEMNPVPNPPSVLRGSECTPDWFPDCKHLIFSHNQSDRWDSWTQLWMADAEGTNARLLYAEDGRHIYGGMISPDGKYVLFNGLRREDEAGALTTGTPMGLFRFADAPVIGGDSPELRKLHADAKSGPLLTLPVGWEPDWTYTEIGAGK
jgi:Tol biopolymer transport system component